MSEIGEALGKLLENEKAEVQCAAAMVIGELGLKDAQTRKMLCRALEKGGDSVKVYLIDALGRMGSADIVPQLLPHLGGPPLVRNKVIETITAIGPTALPALEAELAAKESAVRLGVLEVFGRMKGTGPATALLNSLFDDDAEVVKQATAVVKEKIEEMNAEERKKLGETVLKFMSGARVRKSKTVTVSCMRILGALRDPGMAGVLLEQTGRKVAPPIRAAALLALANIDYSQIKNHAPICRKLFPLLGEDDYADVVANALTVLWKLEIGKEHGKEMLKLLKGQHHAVRMFALKALGSVGGKDAAAKLIEALVGDDHKMHEMAASALRGNPQFSAVVIRELRDVRDIPRAWKLANVLKSYRHAIDKTTLKTFLAKCLKLLDGNEGGFQIYFEILRSAAPDMLRETLLRRGRDLLRRKKFDAAQRALALLEREDLATAETEYTLALAELKLAGKDLTAAGRGKEHVLQLLGRLVKRGGFDVAKALRSDAALLDPEDVLYIGFHFIERVGPERLFGAEVLKFVAKRFARRNEGKTAQRKLHSEGM